MQLDILVSASDKERAMANDKTDKFTPAAPATSITALASGAEATEKKVRSETPYPYYGLSKGVDIAKAVQRVAGNAPAPAAALLAELGVNKNDRLWAYGIPATVYFGLIERIGRGDDAQIKLTDLGRRIALPGTPDEERLTKATAARTPELYARLLEQFAGHPVPSKEALKNILQRDYRIVESMAGNAADAFLDSIKVAELVSSAGAISMDPAVLRPDEKVEKSVDVAPPPPPGTKTMTVPADFVIYKCKISGGQFLDIALPPKFRKVDVDKLHAFLQTQIDDEA
jgi:hypothetical protein